MPKLDEQVPVPQPRQPGRSQPAHQALTPQPVRQVSEPGSAPDLRDRPCGWHPAAGAERAGEGVLSHMLSLWCSRSSCSHASAGSTGSHALAEVTGELLYPRDRPAAGAVHRGDCTVYTCAPSPASRSPGCSLGCTTFTSVGCIMTLT
jgi:hypothetical protein